MKNIYSKRFLTIFFILPSYSHANEPSWLPIEINHSATYLLDEQSISHDGYSANAILIIRPSAKQALKDLLIGSASYVVQAQCINKAITLRNGALYEDASAQGKALKQDAISHYHEFVPTSVDQKLILHLCMN
ncbi:MAG: surface-adhesin E family protein [Methylocystis sp.]